MKHSTLVIGIGELLWDVFPDKKKMGGAPANFAYHVSKCGIESCVISAVGNDELGDELISRLTCAGLKHDIQQTAYLTGTVQITLNEQGVPQYEICQPVAWDNIQFKPEWVELASHVSAICFGSLAQRNETSKQTIQKFLKLIPTSSFKVFDINLRQHFYSKSLIEDSLEMCNVLKINEEELSEVCRLLNMNGSRDNVCQILVRNYNLTLLVLTYGTEGSYLYTTDRISFRPTPLVKVADTVGAGDSFTAAIVVGLLKHHSLEDMHETAVSLSAFVCTRNGAMPDYHPTDIV